MQVQPQCEALYSPSEGNVWLGARHTTRGHWQPFWKVARHGGAPQLPMAAQCPAGGGSEGGGGVAREVGCKPEVEEEQAARHILPEALGDLHHHHPADDSAIATQAGRLCPGQPTLSPQTSLDAEDFALWRLEVEG